MTKKKRKNRSTKAGAAAPFKAARKSKHTSKRPVDCNNNSNTTKNDSDSNLFAASDALSKLSKKLSKKSYLDDESIDSSSSSSSSGGSIDDVHVSKKQKLWDGIPNEVKRKFQRKLIHHYYKNKTTTPSSEEEDNITPKLNNTKSKVTLPTGSVNKKKIFNYDVDINDPKVIKRRVNLAAQQSGLPEDDAVAQFMVFTAIKDVSIATEYITQYENVEKAVTAYYDKSSGISGKGIKSSKGGADGVGGRRSKRLSNKYVVKAFMDLLTDGRIYPRGLVNIGNTCFSGSVLQLIGANPLVREYFRNDDYLHHIIAEGRLGSEGRLVIRHVAEVIRMMWHNTDDDSHQMGNFNRHPPALRKALEDLRTQISRRYSRFGAGQHDISEYEKVLTEILHEDTNRALHNNPWIEQKVYTNHHPKTRDETFMTAANRTFLAQQHLDSSPYRNIFLSQLASCKTCSKCNHTSISFSTDTSIDVSIPPQHDNGQAFSLMECINNTWNDGSVCEYTCDECHHKGTVPSQTYLASTPQAIIVHIKRYTDNNLDQIGESRDRDPSDYNANQQRRVNNLIQCPMILNTQSLLHPEVDPSPSDDQLLYQLVGAAKQIPDSDSPNDITQGHYVSYVIGNDSKWYECDDAYVKEETDISQVIGPNTVALHYVRKDLASEETYLVDAFNDAQVYDSQTVRSSRSRSRSRQHVSQGSSRQNVGVTQHHASRDQDGHVFDPRDHSDEDLHGDDDDDTTVQSTQSNEDESMLLDNENISIEEDENDEPPSRKPREPLHLQPSWRPRGPLLPIPNRRSMRHTDTHHITREDFDEIIDIKKWGSDIDVQNRFRELEHCAPDKCRRRADQEIRDNHLKILNENYNMRSLSRSREIVWRAMSRRAIDKYLIQPPDYEENDARYKFDTTPHKWYVSNDGDVAKFDSVWTLTPKINPARAKLDNGYITHQMTNVHKTEEGNFAPSELHLPVAYMVFFTFYDMPGFDRKTGWILDHINGIKKDNKFCNLWPLPNNGINTRTRDKLPRSNTSGINGVGQTTINGQVRYHVYKIGDAIGGILSVVAHNVTLTISVPKEIDLIDVYYDKKNLISDKVVQVHLGDVYAEETRDVLFEVTLACPRNLSDTARLLCHGTVQLSYEDTIKHSVLGPLIERALISRPNSSELGWPNQHVAIQWLRVRTANVISNAEQSAKMGEVDKAKKDLSSWIQEFEKEMFEIGIGLSNALLAQLHQDCKESLALLESTNYNAYEHTDLGVRWQAHLSQRCSQPLIRGKANVYRTAQKALRAQQFDQM